MGNEKDERNVENSLLNDISDIDQYDFGNEERLVQNLGDDPDTIDNSLKNDKVEIDDNDFTNEEANYNNMVEDMFRAHDEKSWIDSLSDDAVTKSKSCEQNNSELPDVEECR